jgi:uncharacterized membrane protein HdeD (DUF308 family)
MHVQVPPALLYVLGAILVLFGSLRAVHLGWQRRDRPVPTDDDEAAPARKQGPRYHLGVGILWVVMGLFLIISTYVQSRR